MQSPGRTSNEYHLGTYRTIEDAATIAHFARVNQKIRSVTDLVQIVKVDEIPDGAKAEVADMSTEDLTVVPTYNQRLFKAWRRDGTSIGAYKSGENASCAILLAEKHNFTSYAEVQQYVSKYDTSLPPSDDKKEEPGFDEAPKGEEEESLVPSSSASSVNDETMEPPRKKNKAFDRLSALEEVKGLLTKEEYANKRSEIIKSI